MPGVGTSNKRRLGVSNVPDLNATLLSFCKGIYTAQGGRQLKRFLRSCCASLERNWQWLAVGLWLVDRQLPIVRFKTRARAVVTFGKPPSTTVTGALPASSLRCIACYQDQTRT